MRLSADRRRELGIDQVLHPALEQPAEQILGVTITESTDQVGNSGIIVMGHRVVSLSECFRRSHQESRDGPPHRVDPATYTTSWDTNHPTDARLRRGRENRLFVLDELPVDLTGGRVRHVPVVGPHLDPALTVNVAFDLHRPPPRLVAA